MGYIVFGNDKRMNEVRKLLISYDTSDIVCIYPPNMLLLLEDIKRIPYGARVYARGISEECAEIQTNKKIQLIKYDDSERFVNANSKLTAEATISIMLNKCQSLIEEKEILLIGFGKCGKEIAKYLYAMNTHFTIMTGNPNSAEIFTRTAKYGDDVSKYDIIINTAPCIVIDNAMLCQVKRDGVIIDIASSPYGLDHERARELGIDSNVYPALPAKHKTSASAKIIVDLVTGG